MEYIMTTDSKSIYYAEYQGDVHDFFEYVQQLPYREKWLKCISYDERKTLLDVNRIESIQVMRKGEFSVITDSVIK
ncbi:hypothetical protein QI226_11265 [Staphylococcus saprophyticus]|nr:hypothetical protein [Staphylococcus saprophyticus]